MGMSVYRFPMQWVELTDSGEGGKRFQRFRSDPTHPVEVTCPGCFHPQQWDANGACPVGHHRINAEGRSGALLPVGTQLKV